MSGIGDRFSRPRRLAPRLDKPRRPSPPEPRPIMTVCIAALCRWNYPEDGDPDRRCAAVVTCSDRMQTDSGLGLEYESAISKWGIICGRISILVAGNTVFHSDFIRKTMDRFEGENPSVTEVSEFYAACIIERRKDDAEKRYLAPLGLTMEDFVSKQNSMKESVVRELLDFIVGYDIDVEAIVCGCDGETSAHIFKISSIGLITCHDDIGFAAIGNGDVHAVTYLMSLPYWNGSSYSESAMALYLAKKRSEAAPGVGRITDMSFLDRHTALTLNPGVFAALESNYQIYNQDIAAARQKYWFKIYEATIGNLFSNHNQPDIILPPLLPPSPS